MASVHAGPGDWNNFNGRHAYRDYRQTATPNCSDWYYTQRRAQWDNHEAQWDNHGAPTPEYYDPYEASHPVDYYEAGPQETWPHPHSQGPPRAAQKIRRRHHVAGPDWEQPPTVTVHHTEQVPHAHSGPGNQAHHSGLHSQAHPPRHTYRPLNWKFHHYPPDWRPPMYHQDNTKQIEQWVGYRPRRQSWWGGSRGGQSSGGRSTSGHARCASKAVAQNTPSSQSVAGSSQEVHSANTAPTDTTLSQPAPPVKERGSDSSVAQQCSSQSPDLKGSAGPDAGNPTASPSTHADDSSQVPPSTVSACATAQEGTATPSSQSLAPNQGTTGDCVSSSGVTQPECSPPVTAAIRPTPAPVTAAIDPTPAPVTAAIHPTPAPVTAAIDPTPAPVTAAIDPTPAPVTAAIDPTPAPVTAAIDPTPAPVTAAIDPTPAPVTAAIDPTPAPVTAAIDPTPAPVTAAIDPTPAPVTAAIDPTPAPVTAAIDPTPAEQQIHPSDLSMTPPSDLSMTPPSDLSMTPPSDLSMTHPSDLSMTHPSDLSVTPKDRTPEKTQITIKEIKQWLEKSIDRLKIIATNDQIVNGHQNAGKPNGTFAAEKINILQPGRRTGQPRDKPWRTSDGSREEDSTLRLEIQSSSRCVLVKTVPVAPPPVAVVPPLEPEVRQPVETEGSVHGSTEGRLLTINENGKVSESCTKSTVMADDNSPENNICGRTILVMADDNTPKNYVCRSPILERLLAADASQDLPAVADSLVNKLSVHSETSSSAHVHLAEDSHVNHRDSITEDLNEAKESVLDVSSIAVIDYTLSDLRKLVAGIESSSVPQGNKDNALRAILDCFWGGDIEILLSFNLKDFFKEIADFKPDVNRMKTDRNRVVLTAVDGITLEELFDKCPSVTDSNRSSSDKFRSSWLNVNEKVDDIDQEPGVAWPLYFTPEIAEAETSSKKHAIDTETSDVEMNEAGKMERGTKTDVETEVQTDMKMEAQTKTGTSVQRSKETHTALEGPSHTEIERVDITPEVTMATEAPRSDEEPHLNTSCEIKMTLLSPEDAKKLFDQLQNDPTLSVPPTENKGRTKTKLDEDVVGQEEQNTPDLHSVEEEPARLEKNGLELSCCGPSLIETPDRLELGLRPTSLTEVKIQEGDVSEIQGGRRKGLHNILKPEYFSLSEDVSSDQEDTEEVSMEPESHTKAQELPGDWMEPFTLSDLTIDSRDEKDVMHQSDMTLSSDQEETKTVDEKTNEQTDGEQAQPIVPSLAITVTNETETSVLKNFSKGRGQGGPCSPLEVFESISAFLISQSISLNSDSMAVMSLSEIENNHHRLKIPKIAQRLGSSEFDLESESQAKDNQCMDSETQIPHKRRLATPLTDNSSVETDSSSDRPKTGQRRRHSTKSNEDYSTKKHVALKRTHPISIDTTDSESDTDIFEYKRKRLTTPLPARHSSEPASNIQYNKVFPLPLLICSDVTDDSSDDCTLLESRWERPKTSPTERLTSETPEDKSSQSIISVSENSSDDSAVSQHGPMVKRLECSSGSPPLCAGVQSLLVQQSLTGTAPLQLRRKTLEQILQKEKNAESTKPRPQSKERPSIVELSQVKKLYPSISNLQKMEKKEKPRSDEQKLSIPESSPKSPLRENGGKGEEETVKEQSYHPSSSVQNREKKTEETRAEHEGKNNPNKDQTDKKRLNPERNSSSSKPELPKIPKFHKDENKRMAVPTVHTPRTSSCHSYPVEEKESKEEKRDAQKSSCSESMRRKEKKGVKKGGRHSSGPKVSGSSSQTGPSIAKAAPSPTKGPVYTTISAREQVHSNWKSGFIPTPIRRRRRSDSIEDHTHSPMKNSKVQSGSREDHAAPPMKNSKVQSTSKEYHTPSLMKKSMVEAERWTKANHREILRDYRHSSSHGTLKTNEQHRTFEERHQLDRSRNRKNIHIKDWNRSRKEEGQNPLDQHFRK